MPKPWRSGLAAKQRQAEQERLAAEQRKAEEERLAALRQAEELAAQQRKAEEERLAEQKAGSTPSLDVSSLVCLYIIIYI